MAHDKDNNAGLVLGDDKAFEHTGNPFAQTLEDRVSMLESRCEVLERLLGSARTALSEVASTLDSEFNHSN